MKFKDLYIPTKKPIFEATLYIVPASKIRKIGKCSKDACVLLENLQKYNVLNELFELSSQYPEELSDFKEELYIIENLTVQIAGKENGNNRYYPKDVLERAVENAQRFVQTRQMIGELDHISSELNPENPYPLVSRASHLILNLWMEDDKVKADILILPTIYGKHLLNLLKAGAKIGVSVRGLGNVDYSGRVNDFEILTYDFVSFPSYSDLLIDKSML
ncbi:MAG: hypothetical protein QXO40_04320, partial [Candidatus Aenigmatarchaeota archaeon]